MNKDLFQENLYLLEDAIRLVEKITNNQYEYFDSQIFMSPLGKHLRHVLDFYQAFLNGITTGKINYDERQRDETIETQRDRFITEAKKIAEKLKTLKKENELLKKNVRVTSKEGKTGQNSQVNSNGGRELEFLLSHTVHHFAIIAMILKIQSIAVPEDFGIARSTIEYLKTQG